MGVSCSCLKLTGLPDNGVPCLASSLQGSPAHFRETSADWKRSSYWSFTYLGGTFSHVGTLVPFPEIWWNIPDPFCQVVLITWLFSSLASWLTGLTTLFPNGKWLGNATVDSWGSVSGGKSLGVATTALYRGQEDSTIGNIVGKTARAPSHPQVGPIPGIWYCGKAPQRQ